MTHPLANRLHLGKNDNSVNALFGMPYAVVPIAHVKGIGHEERVKACFYGGLSIELSRAAAIELARRLPEALAHLPLAADEIHDAIEAAE